MHMSDQINESSRDAMDISAWENEGGALAQHSIHHNYDRRVEMDGSWTIYHVFTGVPAVLDGRAMTGLRRAEATTMMINLNARNALGCKVARRAEVTLSEPTQTGR
ncbi:hypothetical protein [Mesorhizobium sp. KR1-2]|uniref:hypothetical protein n=1 Tax=Mesorhizobium sp. KR1-2 TaxID=3156609 RepID=UPI0032B4C1C5